MKEWQWTNLVCFPKSNRQCKYKKMVHLSGSQNCSRNTKTTIKQIRNQKNAFKCCRVAYTLLAVKRLQGLTALFFSLINRRLNLQLPKFSISGSYDVKTLFEQMGITEVFSGNADLSGISVNHDLQVSQVSRQSWWWEGGWLFWSVMSGIFKDFISLFILLK